MPSAFDATSEVEPAPAVPVSELPSGVAASAAPPNSPPPAEPTAPSKPSSSHPSPAAPSSVRLASGETLALDGIAYSPDQPVVMINGVLLSPGERIAGCRVTAIDRDQVTLATPEGSTIVLRLP